MILDLSAGNRSIWFDKDRQDCIFVDKRFFVRPTLVADSARLPFADNIFELVIFDPPHVNYGRKANMSSSYGWHTTKEIKTLILDTAREAYRVTRLDAFMAFKWNDHDQRLGPVLSLMGEYWDFLFGHSVAVRMKRKSETFWTLLKRRTR